MYYRNYLDGLLPIEELLVAIIPADEKQEDNTFDNFYTYDCVKKMREPVAGNGYFFPVGGNAIKKLTEMAWYFDAEEPETEPPALWDEKARAKMREPVGHGFRILLDTGQLRRLAELV